MNDGAVPAAASESTSRTLLRRTAANDPEAWGRLSKVYGPLVYQWCRRANLQADDAADVVQEVFRSVAKRLCDFRLAGPGASFRGWLWTIARNKVRDHHRRRQNRPLPVGGSTANQQIQQLPELPPDDTDGDQGDSVRSQLADRALALMRTDFEETTWQAFWKTAIEQKAASQAAEELGLSTAAVYMAKSRVLRRLREEFAGLDLID